MSKITFKLFGKSEKGGYSMKNINLGQLYKKARIDRGLSLKNAGQGVLSKSTLSDFERNNTDIKFSSFQGLLKNLNITFHELLLVENDHELESFAKTWEQAKKDYYSGNIKALRGLLKRQEFNLKNQEIEVIYDKLNYLQLKNIASRLDESLILSSSEKEEIIDYLNKVRHWNYYDTTLYSNILDTLTTEAILDLSEKVVTRSGTFNAIPGHKQLIIGVLVNTTVTLVNRGKITEAIQFGKQAEGLVDETELFWRLKLHFTNGEIDYYQGNHEAGKEKMLAVVDICEKIGSPNLAASYYEDYGDLIKKF